MQGFAGHRILVFSLETAESRVIDREGEGPGEFKEILGGFLDHSGDTLVIAERNRITFLEKYGRFARSFTPPIPVDVRSVRRGSDGDFIMAATVGEPDSAGLTPALHRISDTGELLSSFGRASPEDRPRLWPGATEGEVWLLASLDDGFRAERWDAGTQERTAVVTMRPEWWSSPTRTAIQSERALRAGRRPGTPPSRATALKEGNGVLWVTVAHASPSWAEADLSEYDPSATYDAVLLAVEIDTGAVMASRVLERGVGAGFSERGRLVTYELSAAGHPRIRLLELSLAREGDVKQ